MADSTDQTDKSAEKAYAEAASEVKPVKEAAAPAPEPAKPVVAEKKAAPKKPVTARRKVKQPASSKPAAKTAFAKAAKRAARVAKAAAAPVVAKTSEPKPTVRELKEKIMATAQKTIGSTDFTQPIADVVGEFQARAKTAYEKSTEVASEVTEFAKGNVEALVESTKIFAAGAQSLGKTYVEEAKSAYETVTADVKELAAVKTPAELFQLQGKIARRNFDTFVQTASKNSEAFFNLANEAFAPLSGRVNVAAEKLSKVA